MSKDTPKSVLEGIKNGVPLKKGALSALLDSIRAKSRSTVAPEGPVQGTAEAGNQAPVVQSTQTVQAPGPAATPAPQAQPAAQPARQAAPAQAPGGAPDSQTPVNYLQQMVYAAEQYPVQMDILTMIRNILRAHILSGRKKNPNQNGIAENLMDYFGFDEQNLIKILQAVFASENPRLLKPRAIETALRGNSRNVAEFVYKEMFGLPTDSPNISDKVKGLIDNTIGKNLDELPDLLGFNADMTDKIYKIYQTITMLKKAINDDQINIPNKVQQIQNKILEVHRVTKSKGEVSIDDELDLAVRVFQLGPKKHRVTVKNAQGADEEALQKFDEQTIEQMLDEYRKNPPPSKS